MNRLPRRSARIQPPTRGRLAAVPPLGEGLTPMIIVRQRPAISGRITIVEKPGCNDLHPDWLRFYKQWSGVFRVLDRPWKWTVVLIILIIMSISFGMQL